MYSLMSQFTIAADGRGALRLASVELSPPDQGYTVESGRSGDGVQVRSTPQDRLYPVADRADCEAWSAAFTYIQDPSHGQAGW